MNEMIDETPPQESTSREAMVMLARRAELADETTASLGDGRPSLTADLGYGFQNKNIVISRCEDAALQARRQDDSVIVLFQVVLFLGCRSSHGFSPNSGQVASKGMPADGEPKIAPQMAQNQHFGAGFRRRPPWIECSQLQ